jgi:hypothetical protein
MPKRCWFFPPCRRNAGFIERFGVSAHGRASPTATPNVRRRFRACICLLLINIAFPAQARIVLPALSLPLPIQFATPDRLPVKELPHVEMGGATAIPTTDRLKTAESMANIADALAKVLALIGAGLFTYWKFLRGRTFYPRLEPSIAAETDVKGKLILLMVTCKLRNVGLAKIDIDRRHTAIRLFLWKAPSSQGKIKEVQWNKESDRTVDAFARHAWIEGGETIEDSHLFFLDHSPDVSCRVELVVVRGFGKMALFMREKIWKGRGPNSWNQHAILTDLCDPNAGKKLSTEDKQ